mmetsp:Transcript_37283/g.72269  ORF Transcript_37283/g.72269 Transcript_37283/m.72269 type:complete len:430 (-) Transcript_37283:91-1380(-)
MATQSEPVAARKTVWGAPKSKKNVSLLAVMSEQLASKLDKDPVHGPSAQQARPHIAAELKTMGFSVDRINTAALATGNFKTEDALNWLLANPEPEPEPAEEEAKLEQKDDGPQEAAETQDDRAAREMQDRAIAFQLAAQQDEDLSLEEARRLRRPFSKVRVSKDPALDRLYNDQQKAMEKANRQESAENEAYWAAQSPAPNHIDKTNLPGQLREMVTKHDREECEARNAERLMGLEFADDYNQTGDMTAFRLSNRTYNSFKRQIQRLKVRSDRKNMGARRTRASFARTVSGDANVAAAEREQDAQEAGVSGLGPGAACMARLTADGQWCKATVVGLATSLPRRYKVRFDETEVEGFVVLGNIKEALSDEQDAATEGKENAASDDVEPTGQQEDTAGLQHNRSEQSLVDVGAATTVGTVQESATPNAEGQ